MTAALLIGCTVALVTTVLYVTADRIDRRIQRRDAERARAARRLPATQSFQPQGQPSLPPAPAWSDSWLSPAERKGL